MEVPTPIFVGILLVIISIPFIYAQVAGGQIIDLSEKARDFFIEAGKGNIVGQSTVDVFGDNSAIGSTPEDIQAQGGILVFLTSAEVMSIVSTDVDDTISGTGARVVEIIGLDENFTEITEDLNLSGTTPVNTTKEYIRINFFEVTKVGVYGGMNEGEITMTSATSGTIQSFIDTLEGVAHTTHYTVPKGQELIITSMSASVEAGRTINIDFNLRTGADIVAAPFNSERVTKRFKAVSGFFQYESTGGLRCPEMTDLWFSAETGGGQAAEVAAGYDFTQYAIGT